MIKFKLIDYLYRLFIRNTRKVLEDVIFVLKKYDM